MPRLSPSSLGNGTLRQPVLPWVQTWDPLSTGLLGAESIWCKACLEHHACSSSERRSVNMSIFKSSSGEERQICECLEWRGGRVDHPDQLRDGSNVVAAASPAPPGPKTMSHESCEYPETPVKTSLQTNADVQDHALPSTL